VSDPVLDPLNDPQRNAVTHGEGPLLILAGAGSGKTRALTHRMAHLIRDREVAPYRILGVTFTNKAADEMKERAAELVGEHHLQPNLSTFHAFGVEFLREEASALDRNRSFTIYDGDDQRALLRECMEEEGIDPKALKPKQVAGRISRAKDDLLPPDRYAVEREGADGRVLALYRRYQQKLLDNNAYDFGDLIMEPVRLLRRNDAVRERWTRGRRAFRYLLIDEFQDTNPAQYRLASILSEAHRNITAVGDDDQSIYSWRGADVTNILEFEEDFPETTVIRLEQNYRSTGPILDAAQKVIEHNDARRGKTLWTQREEGPEPTVHAARSDYDEAEYVVSTVQLLEKMQGIPPGECAVFFRTNAQTRVFEEVFMRENVPYLIVSGVGFYERKEVKDLMAYLNVLVNPQDDHSLKRIINTPSRGIGNKTLGALETRAGTQNLGLVEALENLEEGEISGRARSALTSFRDVYRDLREHREDSPDEVLEAVLDRTAYLEEEVESEDEETARRRRENIDELLRVAETFGRERAEPTLAGFVEEISLLTDVDTFEEGSSRVKMMTLHAAKGLEFPVVFMAGMEEGLLPHQNAEYDPERMEEERRLCYVGFTRARRRLYCTWSRSRWMYGSERHHDPSRFLEESGLLEDERAAAPSDPFEAPDPSAGAYTKIESDGREALRERRDENLEKLSEGDGVHHPRFGEGTVREITGSDSSPIALVRFQNGEEKRLALAYAKLEKNPTIVGSARRMW